MSKAVIKVIALDPGVTTGIATGVLPAVSVGAPTPMEVGTAQARWDVLPLWNYLHEQEPNFIVYERFEFRRGDLAADKVELFSRELIGIIRLYSFTHDKCILYPQMPAVIGGYFNDNRLRADNVYKAGKLHANDAARHLLHWYTFGSGYKFNTGGFRPA